MADPSLGQVQNGNWAGHLKPTRYTSCKERGGRKEEGRTEVTDRGPKERRIKSSWECPRVSDTIRLQRGSRAYRGCVWRCVCVGVLGARVWLSVCARMCERERTGRGRAPSAAREGGNGVWGRSARASRGPKTPSLEPNVETWGYHQKICEEKEEKEQN